MYQAYESDHPKGLKLAKQALELDNENTRAYNYLAEMEKDPVKALDLFRKAEEKGRKQLGEIFFKENKGHFWGINETRPYMEAKFGIGNCFSALGKLYEAIRCFQEMLELNPNDNQGVRYVLNTLLLAGKDYEGYQKLYKRYKGEFSAVWLYNHALFLFRTEGPRSKANAALRNAYSKNKYVLQAMTGQIKLNEKPSGTYRPGHESEAVYYLMDNYYLWMETDGIMDWIVPFAELMKKAN
jgi:tetratricopeptide (TPR) repeat protein